MGRPQVNESLRRSHWCGVHESANPPGVTDVTSTGQRGPHPDGVTGVASTGRRVTGTYHHRDRGSVLILVCMLPYRLTRVTNRLGASGAPRREVGVGERSRTETW